MTGAAAVMDCADLLDAFDALGVEVPLDGPVLDVGCGTGRLAQLVHGGLYTGVDVSVRAVDYCLDRKLSAWLIDGPEDLVRFGGSYATVACLSVFTHVGRDVRRDYLGAFARVAPRAVVDILPGPEGGGVAAWYADPADFLCDARGAGWEARREHQRVSPDGVAHRYYLLDRRP
jgi:SAM-dependent methyltransferase